jgi:hypothetical protein
MPYLAGGAHLIFRAVANQGYQLASPLPAMSKSTIVKEQRVPYLRIQRFDESEVCLVFAVCLGFLELLLGNVVFEICWRHLLRIILVLACAEAT